MQYELIFIDRGSFQNSVHMFHTIQKVKKLYPDIAVSNMFYHKDNNYGLALEPGEICIAVLMRDQNVLCKIKGDTPFSFFRLWLEEKIMEDGGAL